jgi:hypothetical protein
LWAGTAAYHVMCGMDGLARTLERRMASTINSAPGIADRPAVEAPPRSDEQAARSNYGAIPGSEFPVAVYISVFLAFAWIVLASWLAFANGADADLALGVAGVLTVVFFALPVLIRLTATAHPRSRREKAHDFLASRVETATGTLSGASAWLQVVLIPAALALAATLIGAISLLVH